MTWLLFKRDLLLAFRRGGGMWMVLSFALMVFAVFAFTLGPEALTASAARILSAIVLLSCLLMLPGLFERDHEDGSLEQYLVQPAPLEWLMLAKLAAFWCTACLPLIILTPVLALMSGLGKDATLALACALLFATPALSALGALGAALSLTLRQGGLTQTLITLPLYIPPLIFLAAHETSGETFALLAGMSLISIPLSCFLCAGLVRLAHE